ncbi:unnamed protein product [Prunus brigantina]
MSNLRRVLERQQKEGEEIQRRRVEEDRDADEEKEQMLAVAVCMLNQSRQHRRRRASNVDRRKESRGKNLLEDYFIPNSFYPVSNGKFVHEGVPSQTHAERHAKASTKRGGSRFPRNDWKHRLHALAVEELSYCLAKRVWESDRPKSIILEAVASFDYWVWHAFFRVAGSQNELNVLCQSPVFDEVLRGHSPQVTYQINNTVYSGEYYLVNRIYPRWTTFVKTIPNPQSEKERSFASFQEGYRKDVERCFGILQARWAIIRGSARMLDKEVLRSIMMTCIILHNMIVEDESDCDAPEVFEPNSMNTALTRIYERPMGPNGLLLEPELLLRDGQFNNPMIDRYQEMQSSYVHERRQVDLIEHLWEMKGNHNG